MIQMKPNYNIDADLLRKPSVRRASGFQRQSGVALFIALVILVIISVLGIAALRGSITNLRITSGIQASAMSFQAAQTGIHAAMNEMLQATAGDDNNLLVKLLKSHTASNVVVRRRCVTSSDTSVSGDCTQLQFVDSRGLVQAGSESIMAKGYANAHMVGTGLNTLGYLQIIVAGNGSVPDVGVGNVNVQHLVIPVPRP